MAPLGDGAAEKEPQIVQTDIAAAARQTEIPAHRLELSDGMRVVARIQEQELARTFAEKLTRRLPIEAHLAQVLAPLLEPAGRDEIGTGLHLGLQDIASRQEVYAVVELHQVHARIQRRRARLGIAAEDHQGAVTTLGRRGPACIREAASSGRRLQTAG
jgi:hypothetical protein